jgi:hypothetical protein
MAVASRHRLPWGPVVRDGVARRCRASRVFADQTTWNAGGPLGGADPRDSALGMSAFAGCDA